MNSISLDLGGQTYTVQRVRLGTYLDLQDQLTALAKAVEKRDTTAVGDATFEYLNITIPELSRDQFDECPWFEVTWSFAKIVLLNKIPGKLAMLRHKITGIKSVPWDHEARDRLTWLHIIAGAYHWAKTEILNLWPEEAVGLIQEILADQQLDREFMHALSEVAYVFNPHTKKSRYAPLHRPSWMLLRDREQVVTRIPKSMLPVGNIIRAKHEEIH